MPGCLRIVAGQTRQRWTPLTGKAHACVRCRLFTAFQGHLSQNSGEGLHGMEVSLQMLLLAATCISPAASPLLDWTRWGIIWHDSVLSGVMHLLAHAAGPPVAMLFFRYDLCLGPHGYARASETRLRIC
jgi:hypothetical protein